MAQEGNVQVNGVSIAASAFTGTVETPDTSLQNNEVAPIIVTEQVVDGTTVNLPNPPLSANQDTTDAALNGDGSVTPTPTQEGLTIVA